MCFEVGLYFLLPPKISKFTNDINLKFFEIDFYGNHISYDAIKTIKELLENHFSQLQNDFPQKTELSVSKLGSQQRDELMLKKLLISEIRYFSFEN